MQKGAQPAPGHNGGRARPLGAWTKHTWHPARPRIGGVLGCGAPPLGRAPPAATGVGCKMRPSKSGVLVSGLGGSDWPLRPGAAVPHGCSIDLGLPSIQRRPWLYADSRPPGHWRAGRHSCSPSRRSRATTKHRWKLKEQPNPTRPRTAQRPTTGKRSARDWGLDRGRQRVGLRRPIRGLSVKSAVSFNNHNNTECPASFVLRLCVGSSAIYGSTGTRAVSRGPQAQKQPDRITSHLPTTSTRARARPTVAAACRRRYRGREYGYVRPQCRLIDPSRSCCCSCLVAYTTHTNVRVCRSSRSRRRSGGASWSRPWG